MSEGGRERERERERGEEVEVVVVVRGVGGRQRRCDVVVANS